MSVTFKQLFDWVYTALGENPTATSSTFYLAGAIKPLINEVGTMIYNGIMVDEFKNRTLRCWFLSFLYKKLFIQNVKPVKLTATNIIWAITLSADTTGFATAWFLYIEWNIVQYTWKTATSFTGVTGVWLVYNTNAYVTQIFQIPTTATFPMDLRYLNQNYKVQYVDFRDDMPYGAYRQILTDNSNRKFVYIMWYRDDKDQFRLDYQIKWIPLVLDADVCDMPDEWWLLTIPLIVAAKSLNRDWFDMIKANVVWWEGYDNLQNFYQIQSELRRKFKQKIRTTPYDNYYQWVYPNQNIYYRAS